MIAPQASAGFVANMEDVPEVYQRPHDPSRPLVCLDETSKQMIVETRAPIPAAPRLRMKVKILRFTIVFLLGARGLLDFGRRRKAPAAEPV